jgi:hypothetical protein
MNQQHQMLHRILGMQTKVILYILYEEFEDTKGLIRISGATEFIVGFVLLDLWFYMYVL